MYKPCLALIECLGERILVLCDITNILKQYKTMLDYTSEYTHPLSSLLTPSFLYQPSLTSRIMS